MATNSTKPGKRSGRGSNEVDRTNRQSPTQSQRCPQIAPKLGVRNRNRPTKTLKNTRVLALSDDFRRAVEGGIASTATARGWVWWKSKKQKGLRPFASLEKVEREGQKKSQKYFRPNRHAQQGYGVFAGTRPAPKNRSIGKISLPVSEKEPTSENQFTLRFCRPYSGLRTPDLGEYSIHVERKRHDAEPVRDVPEPARSPHGQVTLLALRVVGHERRLSEVSASAGRAVRWIPTEGRSDWASADQCGW